MNYLRNSVKDLPQLPVIKTAEDYRRELDLPFMVPMNANENPLGASPKAVEAIRREAEEICHYPASSNAALREKIGSYLHIGPEHILCSNGADNIVTLLMKAFIQEGDNVVVADPSFAVYHGQTKSMGGSVKEVPVKEDLTLDLDGMADAVDSQTKMVVVINPNNPTGTGVSPEALDAFVEKVPDRAILVLDEAYIDFMDEFDIFSSLKYVKERKNVVILRTFSKFQGLAGLRVGYAITSLELRSDLLRVIETFPVNVMAQAAAIASLDDVEFMEMSVDAAREARSYLTKELTKLGCDVAESQANFLFADTHVDGKVIFEELLHRGFLVKAGWGEKYPGYIRMSFGKMEENQAFVEAMAEILKEY